MEDHGGTIRLDDRPGGGAIDSLIFAADSDVLEDDVPVETDRMGLPLPVRRNG